MVEIVVVDVDEEPEWTGDGVDLFCPLLVFPECVGAVAAAKGSAAAAARQAWHK